jgi:tetratricopeptide (TPR) repeat protein
MSQCAAPCCNKPAKSQCSACLKEWYCSGECQKGDWKDHKKICKILKILSNDLQPYPEVLQVIIEILDATRNVRVLEQLYRYAEFQFGDRISGETFRQRGNSGRIDNFNVEINILIPIYRKLVNTYIEDTSLSDINCDSIVLPYHEKVLTVLQPWSLCVDLDVANRVDSLSKDQIDEILYIFSDTEQSISIIHTHRNQFILSESHCQRALSCAQRYNEEGETKTTLLLKAFTNYCTLMIAQSDFAGALPFAEEAYNCVAIAYNPVHPQVQEAAGTLIDCLMHKGELYDAERFSQLTLDSLKDPANEVDQESEAVAKGYYNLGNVLKKQKEDVVRAEMLARESLRIRTQLYGNDHPHVGNSIGLLAEILRKQGNLGNEVKEMFERSLAIDVKQQGPDGVNTSIGNKNLGVFHDQLAETDLSTDERKEHLRLSVSYYTEALRINANIFGPDHHDTINAASDLSEISLALSELTEELM